jgi:glycosyltransferase involved in cell wall biosynthesis
MELFSKRGIKPMTSFMIALVAPPWWCFPSKNDMTATEHIVEDIAFQLNQDGISSVIFNREKNIYDEYNFKDINEYNNTYIHIKPSQADISERRENANKNNLNYNYEFDFYADYIELVIQQIKRLQIKNVIVFQCLPFCRAIKLALPKLKVAYHVGCNDLARYDNHYNYGFVEQIQASKLLRYVDFILPVSGFIKNGIVKRFPESEELMYICPIGIDKDVFFDYGKNRDVDILYCGRIVPEKGIVTLLDALSLIMKDIPQITMQIFGSTIGPNDTTEIYDKVNTFPASTLVIHPLVPRRQLIPIYNGAKIFVYPVLWDEPFGTAIAEALSCGCCIVASSHNGGFHEYLNDEFNSLIFKEADSHDLAFKIVSILKNSTLMKNLRKNANKSSTTLLSWHNTIVAIRTIFKI